MICTNFVEKLLSGLAPNESLLCEAMTNGNLIYDAHDFVGYLSADEVISHVSVFNVHMSDESFVRPSGLAAMVDLLHSSACNTAPGLVGGVFIVTPYTFAIIGYRTELVLFDSHAHGPDTGALLARVPYAEALDYFRYFFNNYSPGLKFSTEAGVEKVAHFTHLSL